MGRYPFGVERFHLLLHAGLSRRSKTTRGYDRSRNQLNRHATYAIAQYLAGGS